MVGDHFTDLEAGRRAGLQRCFCRYGFGDPQGQTWDLAVDDLNELADRLGA
jgi:phosphoglycolate phosphatase